MQTVQEVYDKGQALTASDSDRFSPSVLWVGGAGTITIYQTDNTELAFTVPAGVFLPVRAIGWKTGGSATAVVRVW